MRPRVPGASDSPVRVLHGTTRSSRPLGGGRPPSAALRLADLGLADLGLELAKLMIRPDPTAEGTVGQGGMMPGSAKCS
jgi:hypothetical protein